MTKSTPIETILTQISLLSLKLGTAEWGKAITEIIQMQLGLYFVGIFRVNPVQQSLHFYNGSGKLGRDLLDMGWSFSLEDRNFWTSAIRSNEICLYDWESQEAFAVSLPMKLNTVTSLALEPRVVPFYSPLLPSTTWELLIPLQQNEQIMGILDIIGNEQCPKPDSKSISDLSYLADAIAKSFVIK
jgi:hypothetical protein